MSIEAMKQALEALEGWANHGDWVWPESALEQAKRNTVEAITALRAAIEHYDQTALELCKECGWRAIIPGDGCLVCARQKAKPVAWMYDFLADDRDEVIRNWVTQSQDDIKRENGFNVRPLYAAPRQWVGLTDEDRYGLYRKAGLESYHLPSSEVQYKYDRCIESYARAIEAKLKEKNRDQ